ncbi:MAG: methylenetetrahydrofolate--tRNA-(uracil(54)-C(5))-methyltransferase (FADH(2)-oxidizing) TrmFO [Bacillota bacterium]
MITVIGGGLAGAEAAWQIAQNNIPVMLYEMRPVKNSPAHHTDLLAELVCSNSLRAESLENAVGLLKEEMNRLKSIIIHCAYQHRIPAGGALAVDRLAFSQEVTSRIVAHPMITLVRKEITQLPNTGLAIIATGPLTSQGFSDTIMEITGCEYFYFYDAASPIVLGETIDFSKAFWASRYGKGENDYINCPMNEEEYRSFYTELVKAERFPLHCFEKEVNFEGCLPVEVLAVRGYQTLLFGPMKPVGLIDPRTGKQPYAVVQLRRDNKEGTLFNLVGFQTNLKWNEQVRIFKMIPGLKDAEFVRFGVMHRNTFINSPQLLRPTMQARWNKNLLFAGQITGVEGYLESAATGLIAGINAARLFKGQEPLVFPPSTAHGALCNYITAGAVAAGFQPMNVNFGLFPPLDRSVRGKKERGKAMAWRSLKVLEQFILENRLEKKGLKEK